MDPKIKEALANIRRRQAEITRKYGKQTDDGPLFDRSRKARSERASLDEDLDIDLLEDMADGQF